MVHSFQIANDTFCVANFQLHQLGADCVIGNWISHRKKKKPATLIKSNRSISVWRSIFWSKKVSWFNGHHVLFFCYSFFPQLNELFHQIEFRIILKQFQNKFNRSKQTDKRRKMANVLLSLAEYAFGQKQVNCVNWKTNENEAKHTKKFYYSRTKARKRVCEWRENGYGINGLSDMKRWGSNNVNILFHRFSCRQTQCEESCEILIFLCYYFVTSWMLFFFHLPFSLSTTAAFFSLFSEFCSFFFFCNFLFFLLVMRIPFGHCSVCC